MNTQKWTRENPWTIFLYNNETFFLNETCWFNEIGFSVEWKFDKKMIEEILFDGKKHTKSHVQSLSDFHSGKMTFGWSMQNASIENFGLLYVLEYLRKKKFLCFLVLRLLCRVSEKSHVDPANQAHPIPKTIFFGSLCNVSRTKLDRSKLENLERYVFGKIIQKMPFQNFRSSCLICRYPNVPFPGWKFGKIACDVFWVLTMAKIQLNQ